MAAPKKPARNPRAGKVRGDKAAIRASKIVTRGKNAGKAGGAGGSTG